MLDQALNVLKYPVVDLGFYKSITMIYYTRCPNFDCLSWCYMVLNS